MPSSKVILSSLLLLSGCVATQRDVMDISNQMDNLGNQISNMEKNQADLALKMDELNQSLSHFSENLRDYQNQSSRMSAKLDDLESTLGRKIDSTGEVIKTQQEEIKKKQQEIESLVLPTKTYQEAYHNLTQKKYDLAVHGFQLYLEKFPKGEWGDKAYYYMGEALSAKGEWKEAAKAYAIILEKYPRVSLTPAARLRYALAILKLAKTSKPSVASAYEEEAIRYLKSVLADYPSSPQAKLAKDRLKAMESAPLPTSKSTK